MKIQILNSVIILLLMGLKVNAQNDTTIDPRDKAIYKTIKIGNQIWLAENLKYFDDTLDAFAYNQDTLNYKIYGALYTWKKAMKVCPEGWHLPSETEFNTLLSVTGDDKEKAFNYLIKGGSSGFEGLLGGYASHYQYGYYGGIENVGFYWTSSEHNSKIKAKCIIFNKRKGKVFFNTIYKTFTCYVRCLQD